MWKEFCCPDCKKRLQFKGKNFFCHQCGKNYPVDEGIPIFIRGEKLWENGASGKKWEEFYLDYYRRLNFELINREVTDAKDTIRQINEYYCPRKGEFFLELGCGPGFYCQEYAEKGVKAFGIDFSPTALRGAKNILQKGEKEKRIFACAEITKIPFKDNFFDFIYGGGVIEHLEEPQTAVNEIYRVLKPSGIVFNTVPLLNLGSLTYRQLWGNIPNFPVLKQFAKHLHVKILKGEHMRFGWEYSFTAQSLRKIHRKASFKEIIIRKYEVRLEFEFIKNRTLRKVANFLAQNSPLFWPMVYVVAKK